MQYTGQKQFTFNPDTGTVDEKKIMDNGNIIIVIFGNLIIVIFGASVGFILNGTEGAAYGAAIASALMVGVFIYEELKGF